MKSTKTLKLFAVINFVILVSALLWFKNKYAASQNKDVIESVIETDKKISVDSQKYIGTIEVEQPLVHSKIQKPTVSKQDTPQSSISKIEMSPETLRAMSSKTMFVIKPQEFFFGDSLMKIIQKIQQQSNSNKR